MYESEMTEKGKVINGRLYAPVADRIIYYCEKPWADMAFYIADLSIGINNYPDNAPTYSA